MNRNTCFLRVDRGWNTTQLSGDYFINHYKLGGVLPYVLGGFFTEGVSITKTMIFYIFFTPVIKFHPFCYGPFPIFSDSSFAPKNNNMKKNTDFLVFHWNWDVSLASEKTIPTISDFYQISWKKLQFNLDRFRLSNILPIPVLLQKAKKRSRKIMFFSVSLELRCVLGFWESYPDRLWFVPNFLGKKLQFNLDRFRLSNFLPISVLLQKAKERSRKIMFFSVSLELRCVLGFWESYPDRLWFVPNFLERSFNLIWTVSDFQIFTDFSFAEILWQRTLSHIFKTFSSDVFGRSFSSILVWTGITLLRFSVRISLQRIFGSDFSSNIFGTYFLFRVFVWIMCFFQVLFVRDFFWEFICRSFLVKISLDMVLVNLFL